MTTRETISLWFDRGVKGGHTNMAIFCDTFDMTDYPIFITADSMEEVQAEVAALGDRLMEVYSLDPATKDHQMGMHRAFNYGIPEKEVPLVSDPQDVFEIPSRGVHGTPLSEGGPSKPKPKAGAYLIASGIGRNQTRLIHANSMAQAQREAYMEDGFGKLCVQADDVMLCQHAKIVLQRAGFTDEEINMFRDHV